MYVCIYIYIYIGSCARHSDWKVGVEWVATESILHTMHELHWSSICPIPRPNLRAESSRTGFGPHNLQGQAEHIMHTFLHTPTHSFVKQLIVVLVRVLELELELELELVLVLVLVLLLLLLPLLLLLLELELELVLVSNIVQQQRAAGLEGKI